MTLPLEYSEEEDLIDNEDWEDEEYEDEDIADETPIKKKKGGGLVTVFILFLLLLGGLGGGYYYISTPQGEALRAKIPESILSMIPLLPIGDNKQAIKTTTEDVSKQELSNNTLDGFSAPPMPAMGEDKFDDMPSIEFADDTVPSIDTVIPKVDFSADKDNSFVQDDSFIQDIPAEIEVIEDANITVMAEDYQDNAPDLSPTKIVGISNNIKPESLIDVEDRLLSLEKVILNIENNMVQKSELMAVNTKMQSELKALRKDIKKMMSSNVKKQVIYKSEKKPLIKKHSKAQHKAVKHVKKTEWVLQSAQPGEARIVEKGKSNGRNISIGDSVPSLGKIISIEQDSNTGYWVVKGSRGSVQQ